MAVEEFPKVACYTEQWQYVSLSRSGPVSFAGQSQSVGSPAGYWKAKLGFHIITDDELNEVRGFLASLDGTANPFYAHPVSWRGRPWNPDGLFGDGLITPDVAARDREASAGYDTNADTNPTLDFRLQDAVLPNATTFQLQRVRGGKIKRGQYFSIGSELHVIAGLSGADSGSGAPPLITARPWLRSGYPAGTPVEFANPIALMRLASADQGAIEITTSPLSVCPASY